MPYQLVHVGVAPTGISGAWTRVIQESTDWTLAGVVDIVAEHRTAAATRMGLPPERSFASIAEAAQAIDFDACVLVVPSPHHAAVCTEALQAGKHAIIEKPFATSYEDARQVAILAEQRSRRLMIDQNYRYMADMILLRQAIREKVAGAPSLVAVNFSLDWPPRTYQSAMANITLLEMGIHHLDALRFVLDSDAQSVSGMTWRPPWTQYQGDTMVSCQFAFAGGVRAHYRCSLESPGQQTAWQGEWQVECERGTLTLGDWGRGYGLYLSRQQGVFEPLEVLPNGVPDPGSSIAGTLKEFTAALREGRRPQSDARDNLRTLAMAFAVSKASTEGRMVDIATEFPPLE